MPRLLLAIAIALVLSGCVWSRLLTWKGQLKEFDTYVTPRDDGPALILGFNEPCIRPGDIGWLLGGEVPSSTAAREDGGTWTTWSLRRDRADSIGLDITLGSSGELADSLRIPPQVLAFIPKDRLLAAARAFGSAEIDKGRHEAAAGLTGADAKPIVPKPGVIAAALGEPDTSEDQPGGVRRQTWRFRLVGADGKLGETTDLVLDLRDAQLVAVKLTTPKFNAWLRLDGTK